MIPSLRSKFNYSILTIEMIIDVAIKVHYNQCWDIGFSQTVRRSVNVFIKREAPLSINREHWCRQVSPLQVLEVTSGGQPNIQILSQVRHHWRATHTHTRDAGRGMQLGYRFWSTYTCGACSLLPGRLSCCRPLHEEIRKLWGIAYPLGLKKYNINIGWWNIGAISMG